VSEQNGDGIIKIGKKGIRKFEFGDEKAAVIVELDVVATFDKWCEVDRSFRDAEGKIPKERLGEFNAAAFLWTKEIIQATGDPKASRGTVNAQLSVAEAICFVNALSKEVEKLKLFFDPPTDDAPSLPKRSEISVEYSA
jgi:hypothetical protein